MSERMRQRASRGPSFIDQMIGERKGQRDWYRIKDRETEKILDQDLEMYRNGSVDIIGEVVITRPALKDKSSQAFSLKNVTVEGNINVVK